VVYEFEHYKKERPAQVVRFPGFPGGNRRRRGGEQRWTSKGFSSSSPFRPGGACRTGTAFRPSGTFFS
jgi:hypothetical protein